MENLSQLHNLLAKIYLYERDVNLNTADWLNRMLLVGTTPLRHIHHASANTSGKSAVCQRTTFTEIYNGSPSTSEINAAINQGVGFYSYRVVSTSHRPLNRHFSTPTGCYTR